MNFFFSCKVSKIRLTSPNFTVSFKLWSKSIKTWLADFTKHMIDENNDESKKIQSQDENCLCYYETIVIS